MGCGSVDLVQPDPSTQHICIVLMDMCAPLFVSTVFPTVDLLTA